MEALLFALHYLILRRRRSHDRIPTGIPADQVRRKPAPSASLKYLSLHKRFGAVFIPKHETKPPPMPHQVRYTVVLIPIGVRAGGAFRYQVTAPSFHSLAVPSMNLCPWYIEDRVAIENKRWCCGFFS